MRCRAAKGSALRCGSSCAISRCVRGGGKACMGGPRGYADACRAFCVKRRLCRFGAGGDGPLAGPWSSPRLEDSEELADSEGGVEHAWPSTWARQGRRVTTAADCLSLLGLDHTGGGPEVKRRKDRPPQEATDSRQVASGQRALAGRPRDARRSAAHEIGADRAGGAATRLTGPDALRPTPRLSCLVLPGVGPGHVPGAWAGPYSHGLFGPCGHSAALRTGYPPVRGTSPVIHQAESSPADSGRKSSSPVPCGRAHLQKPRAHPEQPPDTRRGPGRMPPRAPA